MNSVRSYLFLSFQIENFRTYTAPWFEWFSILDGYTPSQSWPWHLLVGSMSKKFRIDFRHLSLSKKRPTQKDKYSAKKNSLNFYTTIERFTRRLPKKADTKFRPSWVVKMKICRKFCLKNTELAHFLRLASVQNSDISIILDTGTPLTHDDPESSLFWPTFRINNSK